MAPHSTSVRVVPRAYRGRAREQSLFLTVEECREFIEKKLQNGFIVCSCCGTEQKVESEEN
jgi:hypothetical protein